MQLCFTLSMPNVGSWNGSWSGNNQLYAVIRSFSKRQEINAASILEKRSFYYDFGDGWGASVRVTQPECGGVRKIRKATKGFCGYDWMIDEIIQHGRILTLQERRATA